MKYDKAVMNTAAVIVIGGVSLIVFAVLALGVIKYKPASVAQSGKDATSSGQETFTVPKSIVTELGIEKEVHDYLREKIAISSFGDRTFCSFEVLGDDKTEKNITLYLWTLCSELYVANGKIEEGGGVSEPLVLVLEKDGNGYKVAEHKEPESGAKYAQSAQALFPEKYYPEVLPSQALPQKVNERQKLLSDWVREQGKEFYGVK